MELIDRLEQRLESLLEEVEVSLSVLEEENRALKEELEQERSTKDQVMGRIDGLLTKLTNPTDSM